MNAYEFRTVRLLGAAYESCLESENCYRLAFEEASDPDLKYLFSSYSLQRAKFARQLREALGFIGFQPFTAGVPQNVVAGPDHPDQSIQAILGACIRGEEMILLRYKEALAADLSDSIRDLLESQLKEIEAVAERIRQLQHLAQPL